MPPFNIRKQGVGSCSFILLWKEVLSYKSKNKDKYSPKTTKTNSKTTKQVPKKQKTSSKSTKTAKQGFSKEDGQTRTDALSIPEIAAVEGHVRALLIQPEEPDQGITGHLIVESLNLYLGSGHSIYIRF